MFTPLRYLGELVQSKSKSRPIDFPVGGGPVANETLLPPGQELFEDYSVYVPPPPTPGAVELLPGLFGHGNGGFVPNPDGTHG